MLEKLVEELRFSEEMAGVAFARVREEKAYLHTSFMVSSLHCQHWFSGICCIMASTAAPSMQHRHVFIGCLSMSKDHHPLSTAVVLSCCLRTTHILALPQQLAQDVELQRMSKPVIMVSMDVPQQRLWLQMAKDEHAKRVQEVTQKLLSAKNEVYDIKVC